MNGDRVWVLDDPDELLSRRKKTPRPAPARGPQKNPALAFSLSLLFWGAGQVYNRQGKLGLLFFLLMANFYLDLGLIWVKGSSIFSLVANEGISSRLPIGIGAFYSLGVLLWFLSAEHAYYRANRDRTDPFQGIRNRVLPSVCSFLVPGWGQFLNGQAKKGTLFFVLTMAGFLAFPALRVIPFFWPALKTGTDRLFWEAVLVFALIVAPLVLLVWPLSAFDAWKVALHETKKEPLLKRIEYANNRRRMRGWGGLLAGLRPTLLLVLSLVFCLAVSYYYFPREYYVARLKDLRIESSRQKMVLIPRLIDRIVDDRLK
jgi:TM2 domain-containing membrane protein YozV